MPDAVLVGGSAAPLHAGHRESFDHDHDLMNLDERYSQVLEAVEASEGWATAVRASRPPMTTLGSLDAIAAGLRNLRRSRPLETIRVEVAPGQFVTAPTAEESLRVKAYLVVQTWPYEALVETMERGLIGDWPPILDELRREPWGTVARKVQRWASLAAEEPAASIFNLAIEHLRQRMEEAERAEVVRRVRDYIEQSGVTAAEFALLVGTSASRRSTYANGRVMPSVASRNHLTWA